MILDTFHFQIFLNNQYHELLVFLIFKLWAITQKYYILYSCHACPKIA